MAYLKYNTEKMDSVTKTYRECAASMADLQKKMQGMVDDVKDAWKTQAGDAFFDKFDNEWLKGFTQYRETLEHMANSLERASGQYALVTERANQLSLDP